MIDGLIAGRMYGTATRRQGKKGPYVVCKIRTVTKDGDVLFVSVIAFDAAADALRSLADGESVALTGELKPKIGIRKKVLTPALDMVARAVLTGRGALQVDPPPMANADARTSARDEA